MVSPTGGAAGAALAVEPPPAFVVTPAVPRPGRRGVSASCFRHLSGPPAEALECPVRAWREPWWLLETGASSCLGHRAEPRQAPEPLLMAHPAALWFLTSFHSGRRGGGYVEIKSVTQFIHFRVRDLLLSLKYALVPWALFQASRSAAPVKWVRLLPELKLLGISETTQDPSCLPCPRAGVTSQPNSVTILVTKIQTHAVRCWIFQDMLQINYPYSKGPFSFRGQILCH